MNTYPDAIQELPIVKICTDTKCERRGSRGITQKLQAELHEQAVVVPCDTCMSGCKWGVNGSVNGQRVSEMNSENAVSKVREELKNPSIKSDGIGTKSLDELDTVLDQMFV